MIRKLDPKDRSVLRDLLLGAVEHCEISRHLIGSMVHTFYRDGAKYGIPVFTFVGPAGASEPRRVAILSGKQAGDRLSAEVTLELIERLLLQPDIASGLILRMVPILNPVGLEQPQSDAQHHLLSEERVRLQSPQGAIEIGSTNSTALHLSLHADAATQAALELASEDLNRLSSECDTRLSQTLIAVDAPPSERTWELCLGIPSTWAPSVATHVTSQFLLSFFRYLERNATQPAATGGRSTIGDRSTAGGGGYSLAQRLRKPPFFR